ncbi:MAG: APC family permease [Nanoarchaeota archaeon]|nr:APC family permease [Nanoarchaeota archaeon]MBU4124047.1 APC family permease [Nanoarchaeota archaeon]
MPKLKRNITLFEATMYCLCVIIGAGIYVLIGVAAGEAGNVTWLAFLFAALIAGCTGLSYAELSSKLPYNAAEYTYSKEAFESKKFAFGIGWFKLITAIIAAAAVSLGFGGYFSGLFGVSPLIGAILIVLTALFFNIYSVKGTLKISALFVGITIFGLLLIIFTGFGYVGSIDYLDFTFGWNGVFTAAALIFFAFLGFEDVANLSEETKNARKVLPKAIIISIIVSTIIYTLVSLVSISVVPWNELAVSASPLTLVAEVTMGATGALLMSILALFATGSTIFVLFFAYSRMIFGMAEKGSLPLIFMKISKKKRIPYIALICVGIITILFILLQDLKFVASLTDFGALFVFMFVNLSVIVLRYRKPHLHGQFKVPLNIGRFPILPAIGAGFSLYMLTKLSWTVAILSLIIFIIGIIIFSLFIEKKR